MNLFLVTDDERPEFKELVEMNEAEAEHVREGGFVVEELEPISHADFVVAHSPRRRS